MVFKKPLSPHGERRQHPRFAVKLPLDHWQTPGVIQGGLVANISEAGLLMHSVHNIEIGAYLGIRVYFLRDNNSLECIEGNAKIIWMDRHREVMWEGYRYGISITEMAADSQDRLINYLLMLKEEKNSTQAFGSSFIS